MRPAGVVLLLAVITSSASGQASLNGFVREDSTLRVLSDAEVAVGSRSTRTDGQGRFSLRDLAVGAARLQVRRVGYEAVETTLNLAQGAQEHVIYLKRTPTELDTVTVPARRPRGIGREAFAERRALGFGRFIDSTVLRASEARKLPDLIRQEGLRIVSPVRCRPPARPPYCDDNQSKRVAVTNSVSFQCPLAVVLDGVVVYRSRGGAMDNIEWETTFDLTSVQISVLESIEVYRGASEVPMAFGGLGTNCGVLVLWMRRRE
ncbi:MAG: carboxypeptidase regulatory-like domain-containing protein [Gemmatimonadaceae bacterium]